MRKNICRSKRYFDTVVFCHEFISLTFEGDELYTIVDKRTDPSDSKGWTVVIMERGSRFILEQKCGKKDEELFETVMKKTCAIIDNTGDVTFLSDGQMENIDMVILYLIDL